MKVFTTHDYVEPQIKHSYKKRVRTKTIEDELNGLFNSIDIL